jgi:hypothetical protein
MRWWHTAGSAERRRRSRAARAPCGLAPRARRRARRGEARGYFEPARSLSPSAPPAPAPRGDGKRPRTESDCAVAGGPRCVTAEGPTREILCDWCTRTSGMCRVTSRNTLASKYLAYDCTPPRSCRLRHALRFCLTDTVARTPCTAERRTDSDGAHRARAWTVGSSCKRFGSRAARTPTATALWPTYSTRSRYSHGARPALGPAPFGSRVRLAECSDGA